MSDVVTIDLGNSRLKLRRWSVRERARPAGGARLDARIGDARLDEALLLLRSDPVVERVALCSVAAPSVESELVARLARDFGPRFVARLDPGLAFDVRSPERVGRDRAFAARGAWSLRGRAAVVIDAGTCVTVDALGAPSAEAPQMPRFLGGAIAPGPELLADALARGGARLFRVDVDAKAHALGRDTEEALRAGVVVGLRGAVRELVLSIEREAGLVDPVRFWTGGACALLREPPLFSGENDVFEPDLVHLGMLSALGLAWPPDA